jgi:hypothetical protein
VSDYIADYRPVLSPERAPYIRRQKVIVEDGK